MPKYLLLVLILLFATSHDTAAQGRRKAQPATPQFALIDTMTIGGIRPGDLMAAFSRVRFDMDTVFWQGKEGANMFKGNFTEFGQKGECRISTRDGEVMQVAFNIILADSNKAKQVYDMLDEYVSVRYGEPNEGYSNVHKMFKWYGEKRALALKTQEGANVVSLTLTQLAKPATSPKLPRTQK